MTKPKLLDLFCCAGGAAMGYARAGFEVIGVDIAPQPDYPFEFVQGDALEYLEQYGSDFDAIHGSPPCQGYTTMGNRNRGDWPKLIRPLRELMQAKAKPWVIENVMGARQEMPDAFVLHGGMFGLGVDRPRLFDTSFPVMIPSAPRVKNPVGVYGKLDGRRLWTRADGTELRAARTLEQAQKAMGIDWMPWDNLRESIPPAYTELIGLQMLEYVEETEVAA